MDSGVSKKFAKWYKEINLLNFTKDKHPYDANGHGTFSISQIINSNPKCSGIFQSLKKLPNRIFSLKVFDKNLQTQEEFIIRALKHAQTNNIKILSLPFGSTNI